jgi:hypothetical protein
MKTLYMPTYIIPLLFLFFFSSFAYSKPPAFVKFHVERTENTNEQEKLVLPFIFSTEDMGLVVGAGGMITGLHQKQLSVGGTAFTGDSKGVALGVWDYRLLGSERLFVSALGMMGDYPLLRAYSPLPDEVTLPNQHRPGSNSSSVDDFVEAQGSSNWLDIKLEYVFPLGNAEKSGMATYELQGGLLKKATNIERWNPLKTGTTVMVARQFNRYQRYEDDRGKISGSVHAVEFGLYHNNTDLPANPSQGSSQYISFSYTPKWLTSKNSWEVIEFEASKYFSLGANNFAKQNIVALNMWAAYSPSWQVNFDGQGNSLVTDNPPFLEGATLGGMYRLRGYNQHRFHNKAAIYATAEYRMTLNYNPIENVKWLKFLNLDWFQTVLFVEGGRVSPTFNSNTLFSDWKSDVGISLRALTAGIVVRLDFASSAESNNMWVMVGHPF